VAVEPAAPWIDPQLLDAAQLLGAADFVLLLGHGAQLSIAGNSQKRQL
jgi:hypothetical protein